MANLGVFLLQNADVNVLGGLFGGTMILFWLGLVVVVFAGMWKVFSKAGQPGWAVLIPIFNTYILLKIAGRPGWWLFLLLVPVVNIVIAVIVSLDVAKSFGKSGAFGFFLLFLFGGIGYLILGFGDARYLGPAAYQGPAVQGPYGQGQILYAQGAAASQGPGAITPETQPAAAQIVHHFCSKCGAQLPTGGSFCGSCGHQV